MKTNALPKSLLYFYFKYALRGHWAILVAWAVCYAVAMSANVLFPMMERWFIALFERPMTGVSEFISYALPTIILIVGLNVSIDGARTLRDMFLARWHPTIKNQISEELVDYTQRQSMAFWTGRMAGKINSEINYVSDGISLMGDFYKIGGLLLMMVINVGLVIGVNRYVALVFGAVFAFRLVYGALLMRPMNNASKKASNANSVLSGKVVDSLSNFTIVKLFAGRRAEKQYLKQPRRDGIRAAINSAFFQRLFYAVPDIIWDLSYGATMLLCVILYMRGQMSVSEIVFTISVYFSVMASIAVIIDMFPVVIEKLGSARKAYEELAQPLDVVDVPNAPDLRVTRGRIEFKNVSFKYKNKWVLRNFDLVIDGGTRVGLVGASGAGKTTLVNLLMRLYEPNTGEILIDGQNIRDVAQDSLRERIAFIPQDPTMFNRTLRENIGYGKFNATDAEIRTAAKRAAADKFIMDTEKGYDSMVGDRGIKLSGGQRQRVAIARAFLKNAPILILDEATSALDSETEMEIQKSFEQLSAGRTTIAIAHRLSTLRNMDKIVVIRRGRIIEQGTHSQLIRARGDYHKLWKMQSGGFIGE